MSKKNYKAVYYKEIYDSTYESEVLFESEEVLGEYKSKEEARERLQEEFNELVGEFEGCEEGEDYRTEQNEDGCWLWDYTAVEDEGQVTKFCFYVE